MANWGQMLDAAMGSPAAAIDGTALARLVRGEVQDRTDVKLSVEINKERDGIALAFRLEGALPAQVHVAVTITGYDGVAFAVGLPARAFGDSEGRFLLLAPHDADARCARAYIPYGALQYPSAMSARLRAAALGGQSVLAAESVHLTLPAPQTFNRAVIARPLIGLCMSVGCADGKLGTAEMMVIAAVLAEWGQFTGVESEALREVMRSEPAGTVEELAALTLRRFPNIRSRESWLELMAHVAHAGGVVDQAEAEVIRRAATAFGYSPEAWTKLWHRLELRPTGARLAEHYSTLGLSAGSSFDEVKRAYRERVQTVKLKAVEDDDDEGAI